MLSPPNGRVWFGLLILVLGAGLNGGATVRGQQTTPGRQPETPINTEKLAAAMAALNAERVGADELAGIVIDRSGKLLGGVLVDAWTWRKGNETETDDGGLFRLRGLDEHRKTEVKFSKPGYSPSHFPQIATGTQNWVVTLDDRTYLTGRVRDPNGEPVADALIRADKGPQEGDGVYITELWTETRSDADGNYRLYLQPDVYDIQVRVPDVGVARFIERRVGPTENRELDIELGASVVFRARVLDSETGSRVEGVRLWKRRQEGIEGTSNEEGLIEIDAMFAGRIDFNIASENENYVRWWSEECASEWNRYKVDQQNGWQRNFDGLDFDLELDMSPVTILVEKGARITGRVVDPDGHPVAGATVAPALTGSGNSITGDTRFSVRTDEDGRFVSILPASRLRVYNLVAHDGKYRQWRDWANGIAEPITTQPGQEVSDLTIQLTRPATVSGRVVDARGQPVVGRQVRAHAADKLGNRYYDPTAARTGADGGFELKFIRPGTQYIQVEPFWLRAESAPAGSSRLLMLGSGQTVRDLELRVEPEQSQVFVPKPGGELNGKLKLGQRAPEFKSLALAGHAVKLSDYRGRVLLIDFWASWCAPCIEELPGLIETYQTFGPQGLEILGVSFDTDRAELEAFLKKHPTMTWTQLFDGAGWKGDLTKVYGVDALPFTLLLDGEGTIRYKGIRGVALKAAVQTLLAETASQ